MVDATGIIVIEKYYHNNKFNNCVLLVKNKKRKTFEDMGGFIGENEKSYETCVRECKEESRNSLRFNKEYFKNCEKNNKYVDINIFNSKYRSYFIPINNYKKNYYYHNKKFIAMNNGKFYYRETSQITRFKLDDLSNAKLNGSSVYVNDIYGNHVKVNFRPIKAVKELVNRSKLNNLNFVTLKENKYFNSLKNSDYFLKGTKCFYN